MNYAWNDAPFEGQNVFLGDYTWLAAYDGHVYGVWTEAAAGEAGARPGTVVRVGAAEFAK